MITHIITHHFNGSTADKLASSQHHDERIVDAEHKRRFGDFRSTLGWYIGYYKLFLEDGRVIKCREAWEEQAHTRGMNTSSLGYGFAGNFTLGSQETITEAQKESFKREAIADIKEFNIKFKNIVPHRKFASYKDCHGSKLSDDYFRELLNAETDIVAIAVHENEIKLRKEYSGIIGALIKIIVRLAEQLNESRAKAMGSLTRQSSFREIKNYRAYE